MVTDTGMGGTGTVRAAAGVSRAVGDGIQPPPAPLRYRLDGGNKTTGTSVAAGGVLSSSSSADAGGSVCVVSSSVSNSSNRSQSMSSAPTSPKNPFARGTVSLVTDSSAAVQMAAEELVRHVHQSSAVTPGSNPYGAGDASVCSISSEPSMQSAPSIDTSSSPRFSTQAAAAAAAAAAGAGQTQAYSHVSVTSQGPKTQSTGAQNPFEGLTTPVNAPTTQPQQAFTVPSKLNVNMSSPGSNNTAKSAGNTPTNHEANTTVGLSNIQMPALYPPSVNATNNANTTSSPLFDSHGVMLGVRQLEQQQAGWEAARNKNNNNNNIMHHHSQMHQQELTPSRITSTAQHHITVPSPGPGLDQSPPPLIDTSGDANHQDFESLNSESLHHKPLVVYGYLRKQTRNGVWQKRFFETDGEALTYYRSQKRTKLLASLDLAKVGVIEEDSDDFTGCTFTIQVAGKPYYLKAEDRSTCKDWVINLNRVREARIQLGRISLIDTHYPYDHSTGHMKEAGDECVSRVIVKANRQRTTRLNDDEEWKTLYNLEKEEEMKLQMQLANRRPSAASVGRQGADLLMNPIQSQALAQWEKRSTNFEVMKMRLVRWARRIKIIRCVPKEDDVVLHPVGTGNAPSSGAMSSFDTNVGITEDSNTLGDSEMSHSHNEPGRGPNEDKNWGDTGGWMEKDAHNSSRRRLDTMDVGGAAQPSLSPHNVEEKEERTIS